MPEPTDDLAAAVASARWYHCIELPGGVVTPGEYDLPATLPHVPLPASLEGRRCLDVGVRDGFWAFQMEQRGASEVVGIDLDDPGRLDWPLPRPVLSREVLDELDARSRTFAVASRALDSKVRRLDLSVYDLDPEQVGTFDFALIGTLLLHLRDPVGALMAIRRVVTGELIVNEPVNTLLTALHPRLPVARLMQLPAPFWWSVNRAALTTMVEVAGWEIVDRADRPYHVPYGPTGQRPDLWERPLRPGAMLQKATLRKGMPHVWLRARPAPDPDR